MNKIIRQPWTKDELILAINLYCKTPFGKIHMRNKDVIHLANALGRSPGSVSYKLANFSSIDPSLSRKGASNVSKLDIEAWNEFFDNWEYMSFKSEQMYYEIFNETLNYGDEKNFPDGDTKLRLAKSRTNQNFFRKTILASYGSCCITGIAIPELIIASHIVPWEVDEKNRTNPRNGLCLNALHDKAFDSGLITISEDFKVVGSKMLNKYDSESIKILSMYLGKEIRMPRRFLPDQAFLEYHRNTIFKNT